MKPSMLVAAAMAVSLSAVAAMAEDVEPAAVPFEGTAVPTALTSTPGDPAAGAATFADRKLGNCFACHAVSSRTDELFHGNVAPPLDGVADRWSAEELRAIVIDAKKVFGPETVMPGFYSLDVGINVREDLVGKTILTAQEVEDVVAYLGTLKD